MVNLNGTGRVGIAQSAERLSCTPYDSAACSILHAGRQEVSRCGTRSESEESGNDACKRVIHSGFETHKFKTMIQ